MLVLNFSSGYLSVSCMHGKQLEGKEHVFFTIWSHRGCLGIKSWPYLNSYETIRPVIMMPVLKVKKGYKMEVLQEFLSPSPKRCEERQALEAQFLGFNRGCAAFWEIWGILWSFPCLNVFNYKMRVIKYHLLQQGYISSKETFFLQSISSWDIQC